MPSAVPGRARPSLLAPWLQAHYPAVLSVGSQVRRAAFTSVVHREGCAGLTGVALGTGSSRVRRTMGDASQASLCQVVHMTLSSSSSPSASSGAPSRALAPGGPVEHNPHSGFGASPPRLRTQPPPVFKEVPADSASWSHRLSCPGATLDPDLTLRSHLGWLASPHPWKSPSPEPLCSLRVMWNEAPHPSQPELIAPIAIKGQAKVETNILKTYAESQLLSLWQNTVAKWLRNVEFIPDSSGGWRSEVTRSRGQAVARACPFADIHPEPCNGRESRLFLGCSDEGAREGSTLLTPSHGGRC